MKPALLVSAVLSALLLTQCTVPAGGGSGGLPPATKENPFVNSLGMKFVPVPGTNILMCTTETTVAEYQAAGLPYEAPKFPQGGNHPAVNVSWNDAKAWCARLSKREGRKYRLPTDAEWSTAVGGSLYPWGNSWPPPNNCGNYAGQEMRNLTQGNRVHLSQWESIRFDHFKIIGGFSDRHAFTAPAGSYVSNRLGIHDLGGNVMEWCEDRDSTTSNRAHIFRGGSWDSSNKVYMASSFRDALVPYIVSHDQGFRVVIER